MKILQRAFALMCLKSLQRCVALSAALTIALATAAHGQTDPSISFTTTSVAAPFGPQNGDGTIANGNLLFPISFGIHTVGHYSVQPPPTGSFDEGFGRNVKVFPSIIPATSTASSPVAFSLRAENMEESQFLSNGRARTYDDLRTWEKLPAPRGGYRIKNRDGSTEQYQHTTAQGIFLTSITDSFGNTTSISYLPNSSIPVSITLPANRGVITYENDGTHVTQVASPLSAPSSISYWNDLLVETRGPDGNPSLSIEYDGLGLGFPTKLTLGNGDVTTFWYKVAPNQQGPGVLYKIKSPSKVISYLSHARNETLAYSGTGGSVLKVSFATDPVTGRVYQQALYRNNLPLKRVELEPKFGRPLAIVSGNKRVKFSYDPSSKFDSQDFSSPLPTGVLLSNGERTTTVYDPSNSYRAQRIIHTTKGGVSTATQMSWKGAQLIGKTTSVNGSVFHKVTYEYSGDARYPIAAHESETIRLALDERGNPVSGISSEGFAWSLSTTPNLMKVTVNGEVTTFGTAYSADGQLTETSEKGPLRMVRVLSPDGLRSNTKLHMLRGSTGLPSSASSRRAGLFIDTAYAQSGSGWSDAASVSCGPSGGSFNGPGGGGAAGPGGSGDSGPGGSVGGKCTETTQTKTSDGNTSSKTDTTCDGGSPPSPSSSSSSSKSSASNSSKGGTTPTKEEKEPHIPIAGDIYREALREMGEDLEAAGNFLGALPESLAEAAADEFNGFADAAADLPKVAADIFNTYFGSDSYESQSNLFQSVENGDLSIERVATDLATLGLASVAEASYHYANGGSGEEFSRAMGAFGGMTIAGAAIGEAGGLAARGVRNAFGRSATAGVEAATEVGASEAGRGVPAAAESGRGPSISVEPEPITQTGSKSVCGEKGSSIPPQDIAEWPAKRLPDMPEDWTLFDQRLDIHGNPSQVPELGEFVESVKNFPEINGPPEFVDYGVDNGSRPWVRISVDGEEALWYRSSGRAGSNHNTKYPGEWLPIAGKMESWGGRTWWGKDVEAIAYIKQGESFTRYVEQIRSDYNVDISPVTPRPDLGWFSKWMEGSFKFP